LNNFSNVILTVVMFVVVSPLTEVQSYVLRRDDFRTPPIPPRTL